MSDTSDRKNSSFEKVSTKNISGLLAGYVNDKDIASIKSSCRALDEAFKANERNASYWKDKYKDIYSRRIIIVTYTKEQDDIVISRQRETFLLQNGKDVRSQVRNILDILEVRQALREEIDRVDLKDYHITREVYWFEDIQKHTLDINILPRVGDIQEIPI